tara:strand:+ start:644 stop:1627 length:984 start_codon:yes stop_codon:yes gene_type:complete
MISDTHKPLKDKNLYNTIKMISDTQTKIMSNKWDKVIRNVRNDYHGKLDIEGADMNPFKVVNEIKKKKNGSVRLTFNDSKGRLIKYKKTTRYPTGKYELQKDNLWDMLPIECEENIMKFTYECMRENPRWVIPERMIDLHNPSYIDEWTELNKISSHYNSKEDEFCVCDIRNHTIGDMNKHKAEKCKKDVVKISSYTPDDIIDIDKHISNCKVVKLARIYHETKKNANYKRHLKFLIINELWKNDISGDDGRYYDIDNWKVNVDINYKSRAFNCLNECGISRIKRSDGFYGYLPILKMMKDKKCYSKEMFKKYLAYDPQIKEIRNKK